MSSTATFSNLKTTGRSANSCSPLTSSLQWNLVMNSVGFSLWKEWVGVGSVRVGIAAAKARSESPLRKGCKHGGRDKSREQKL